MTDQLDQDSVFYNKIENNSSICTNCYRRLKTYSDPHYTLPDSATAHVEYESHVSKAWFDDDIDSGRPSVKRSYCECGDVDGAKIRPIERDSALEMAERIFKNLRDEGVDLECGSFFGSLKESMKRGDFKFNEEKYFEEATEEAIITNEEE
jgi:hypothetical protein